MFSPNEEDEVEETSKSPSQIILSSKQSETNSISKSDAVTSSKVLDISRRLETEAESRVRAEKQKSSWESKRQAPLITEDIFNLEHIARQIDNESPEFESEDCFGYEDDELELEVSDNLLSWRIMNADNGEDDDNFDEYEDEDYDYEEEEEEEDQFGRTRGTLFPWISRDLDTAVVSKRPDEQVIEEKLEKQSIVNTSVIEGEGEDNSIGSRQISKQVRFSDTVKLQPFQNMQPSSSVLATASCTETLRTSEVSKIKESESKKVSRFKSSRLRNEAAAGTNKEMFSSISNAKEIHQKMNTIGDIIERQPMPSQKKKVAERNSESSTEPPNNGSDMTSMLTPVQPITMTVIERQIPHSSKDISLLSTSLKSKEKSTSIMSTARTKANPTVILRPGQSRKTTKSAPVEQIDVEKLIQDSIIPNLSASRNIQDTIETDVNNNHEDSDENESNAKQIMSESVIERPFEGPRAGNKSGHSRKSLFKKSRQRNSASIAATIELKCGDNETKGEGSEDKEYSIENDVSIDPEIHRQEIAVAYHRMRQKMIDKQGGYSIRTSERDFVPLDEDGEVQHVSRFKSARLFDRPLDG
ncbi:hypothetical protein V1511DRAFT_226353 [Dipodascopsis uninucleata]